MNDLGHDLATSKGMGQEHFAAIQCRLADTIEHATREIEHNRKFYGSCPKCNKIFLKEMMVRGVCRNCLNKPKIEELDEDEQLHLMGYGFE